MPLQCSEFDLELNSKQLETNTKINKLTFGASKQQAVGAGRRAKAGYIHFNLP